jgi:hypothetical protein
MRTSRSWIILYIALYVLLLGLPACQREPVVMRQQAAFNEQSLGTGKQEVAGQSRISTMDFSPNAAFAQQSRAQQRIRNARVELNVQNAKTATASIKSDVQALSGEITAQTERTTDGLITVALTIRVPSDRLEQAIERLAANVTSVVSKSLTTEDVTEQYVDVEARLKTKRELAERYREILKQAKSVQDILAVEQQLNSIRADIESQQGQLNYLQNRIAESTIELALYERLPYSGERESFGSRLQRAFVASGEHLQSFVIIVVESLPVLILLAGALFLMLSLWRRWKARRKASSEPTISPESTK